MRFGIVVVALWPILGLYSVAEQEKATHSRQDIVGGWVNTDKDTRGLKRLAVAKQDDTWTIEAWGSGGGGDMEIPWDKTSLSRLGDGVGSNDLPYRFATWDQEFAVKHLTLRMEKDKLVVETFTIFKDKSGRSDYRSAASFNKK